MKLSTVIWDWNGTLLNDVALCARLLDELLARHGYQPLGDVAAYRGVFGFPIRDYYQRAGFDFARHPYEDLAAEWFAAYTAARLHCPLQPGARDVLRALREKGVRQVVLSASHEDALAAELAHFALRGYFEEVLGLSDFYAASKVARGAAWLAASGLNPAEAVLVGDSLHDWEVARALGTRCVLFSGGHQLPRTLATAGAPVIARLTELLPLL